MDNVSNRMKRMRIIFFSTSLIDSFFIFIVGQKMRMCGLLVGLM